MSIIKKKYTEIKRLIFRSRTDKIIDKVVNLKLTYLSKKALNQLSSCVIAIEKNKIPGIIIETGCALGGSAILIAIQKGKQRNFKVYDSFGMMPEPSVFDEEDVHNRFAVIKGGESKGIGDDLYYGYESNLLEKVKANFSHFGLDTNTDSIDFIKGFYGDVLIVNEPVALAHIDCDWYESVKVSLERIVPHLVKGGYLIIDDYYRYSGCNKAVNEYFEALKKDYRFYENERLLIKKLN